MWRYVDLGQQAAKGVKEVQSWVYIHTNQWYVEILRLLATSNGILIINR
jgi:hypothetical protein